jgi:iduronate 2-sulfatase
MPSTLSLLRPSLLLSPFSLLLSSTLLLLSPFSLLRAAEPRPNVLLILVDDLKPLTGSYGDPLARTPNIDRLAARGVQFDLAYCNQAVCAPSRFNLMLGSRSTSTGLYGLGNNLRDALPDAVTLPQHFARHGYRTESLGKVLHVGHGNLGDPASFSVPHFKEKVIEYVLPESTGGKVTREEALFENIQSGVPTKSLPRGAAWESPDVADESYADGRVAAETIKRLRAAQDRSGPFFIAAGFARPHLPFTVPKKYWDLYDPAKFQLAQHTTLPTGAPAYAVKGIGELNQYEPIPDKPPVGPEVARKLIHGYYASTSYMDAQVGRVLAELDRLGLARNTLIVFWGDNGFSFGTHGDWTKHTNYEEANHIPIIFAGPGITAGARTKALIETVDIFPTLCALAGLPAPAGPQPIDGLSQVPVLRDPKATVRDHAYHAFPRQRPGKGEWLGRAIRTARYRLVEWKSVRAPAEPVDLELYDYVADPGETVNVAAQQPEVVAQLRALLARHPAAKLPVPAKR